MKDRDAQTHEIDPKVVANLQGTQWSAADVHEATEWAKVLKSREAAANRALEILSRF